MNIKLILTLVVVICSTQELTADTLLKRSEKSPYGFFDWLNDLFGNRRNDTLPFIDIFKNPINNQEKAHNETQKKQADQDGQVQNQTQNSSEGEDSQGTNKRWLFFDVINNAIDANAATAKQRVNAANSAMESAIETAQKNINKTQESIKQIQKKIQENNQKALNSSQQIQNQTKEKYNNQSQETTTQQNNQTESETTEMATEENSNMTQSQGTTNEQEDQTQNVPMESSNSESNNGARKRDLKKCKHLKNCLQNLREKEKNSSEETGRLGRGRGKENGIIQKDNCSEGHQNDTTETYNESSEEFSEESSVAISTYQTESEMGETTTEENSTVTKSQEIQDEQEDQAQNEPMESSNSESNNEARKRDLKKCKHDEDCPLEETVKNSSGEKGTLRGGRGKGNGKIQKEDCNEERQNDTETYNESSEGGSEE